MGKEGLVLAGEHVTIVPLHQAPALSPESRKTTPISAYPGPPCPPWRPLPQKLMDIEGSETQHGALTCCPGHCPAAQALGRAQRGRIRVRASPLGDPSETAGLGGHLLPSSLPEGEEGCSTVSPPPCWALTKYLTVLSKCVCLGEWGSRDTEAGVGATDKAGR